MPHSSEVILLQKEILHLQQNNIISALKTGTEVEEMDFEEISTLKNWAGKNIPFIVKIGGAEARNDIKFLKDINVTTILAPMVESVYALSNFVDTVFSYIEPKNIQLGINLETSQAINNLDMMIESTAFKNLNHITIGRTDLAKSMHLDINDTEVFHLAQQAIKKIKTHKKSTSIGGALSIHNIDLLVKHAQSDFINSRHFLIPYKSLIPNPVATINTVLSLEKKLYYALQIEFPAKKYFYQERISTLNNRLEHHFYKQA